MLGSFALVSGGLTVAAGLSALRGFAVERRFERLHVPLADVPDAARQRLRWRTEFAGTLAAATLMDTLVALARIDPQVLEAIDNAHGSQAFDNFFALKAHVADVSARGEAAFSGLASQYKGSLGELQIKELLETQGHAVELADTPNQAGWDLLVDRQPVQVKSGLDASGVREALERYPDTPVVTVEEHAGAFDGVDQVEVLPVSGEALQAQTEESLEAIGDAGDLGFEMPVFTAGVAGYRNYQAYARGEMSGEEAVVATALTTGSVAAGAKVGAVLGSALLPGLGTLVGSAIGSWFGRQVAKDLLEKPTPQSRPAARAQRGETARQRRARLRREFQRAADPINEALDQAWLAWAAAASESARRHADLARRAIQATHIEPRLLDRLWPRRSLWVSRAAAACFRAEIAAYEALARDLEAARTSAAARDSWQKDLPVLAGLEAQDAYIAELQDALRTLAARFEQAPPALATVSAGERAPTEFIVKTEPPQTGSASLAVLTLCLCAATVALAKVQPQVTPNTASRTAAPGATGSSAHSAPTATPQPSVTVTVGRCRLRAKPSTQSERLASLRRGTRCAAIATTGRWTQVRCPQGEGFVHKICTTPR